MNFKYYKRHLAPIAKKLLKEYPCLMVSGPRQVGKSTMIIEQVINNDWNTITLDDFDQKELAVTNPKLFFEKNKCPIFIDELQHAPNLMPNIKIIIDQTKQKPGQFILTGSQMFKFNERIKERLSTRTAVLHLRSLSNSEIQERENFPFVIDMHHFASISRYSQIKQTKNLENILRGSLPDIVNGKRKDLTIFYSSYIEETLYGDINENILKIKDVNKFNNFLKATAIRSGQLVNVHNIAENAEIDDDTAIVWLHALESMGIIFYLHPFSAKLTKKLLKKPKLYFYDTGLLCHLLNIDNVDKLMGHKNLGNIFETWCISEISKSYLNSGKNPHIYYLTNAINQEKIDVVIDNGNGLYLAEIKFATRFSKSDVTGFSLLEGHKILGKAIICPSDTISATPFDKDIFIIPNSLI